jgi:hypothetical protein
VLALVSSVLTVQLGGQSEMNNSRVNFLRGQRQALYAQVVRDENALKLTEASYFSSLSGPNAEIDAKARVWADRLDAAYKKVYDYGPEIQIIGSERVRETYTDLLATHNDQRMILEQASDEILHGPAADPAPRYNATSERILSQNVAFVIAARRDLGNI